MNVNVKALLDAIQDSKITADLVVSDRGRLQPVTEIRAMGNVVMLICRPRPDWERFGQGQVQELGSPKFPKDERKATQCS